MYVTAPSPDRDESTGTDWELAAAAGSAHALLQHLAARDGYTLAHSSAVVELALAIGARLGVEGVQLANLHWPALLHDIGKLGVPEPSSTSPAR